MSCHMPTGKILAGTDKGVIVLSLPPPRDDDVKEGAFSEPCVLNWFALGYSDLTLLRTHDKHRHCSYCSPTDCSLIIPLAMLLSHSVPLASHDTFKVATEDSPEIVCKTAADWLAFVASPRPPREPQQPARKAASEQKPARSCAIA